MLKSGRPVYDQAFHEREHHSWRQWVGKSSIADFAFFVLGGEFDNWKKVPAQCDEIQAEITSQGRLALKRNTDSRPLRSAFSGTLKEGVEAGSDGWERFPSIDKGTMKAATPLQVHVDPRGKERRRIKHHNAPDFAPLILRSAYTPRQIVPL